MTLLIQGAPEPVLRGRPPKYSFPLLLTPSWLEAMFPVFPCTLLAPPFPVLGLDSRGVGNLMNSFPPPQGHAQNPLQVGAELQSRFFASQGCNQSPFQAAPAPPPTPQAPSAEPLQVDLLPVLAAAQESAAAVAAAAAAAAAAAPPAAAAASTVDTAALKQPPAPPPPPPASAPAPEAAPPATIAAAAPAAAPTSTAVVAPVATALEKKSKSKGPYICALCAKEFKNGYNLRRHEAIHTGAKAGRAGPGAMRMPTMVPLSLLSVPATLGGAGGGGGEGGAGGGGAGVGGGGVVTTTASGKRIRKNHACEMCGKAFRDVYHLNRHKLSHSDEKPYQCPVCQQRFKRKDRMSYHVRSHDGAVHKPYNCSHCGKSFSRPDHLNSHVRQVHSTERPFKCATCEAAFATKDRLRAHTVRHEEKVPCHVCGKMLSAAYISDHMKVHSQGPHHVCELCNKGTGEVCPMAAAASAAAAAAAAAAAVAAATPTAVGSLSGAEGVPVSSQPLPSQP
ncbi:myc-associated zinc finger protein isoform X3 [Notamacropus eugenii]